MEQPDKSLKTWSHHRVQHTIPDPESLTVRKGVEKSFFFVGQCTCACYNNMHNYTDQQKKTYINIHIYIFVWVGSIEVFELVYWNIVDVKKQ